MITLVIEKFGHRFWADFRLQDAWGTGQNAVRELKLLLNASGGKPLRLHYLSENRALELGVAFENAGCTIQIC